MLGNSADTLAAGRRARHGADRRLLRQGPQDRERHDHRLHRPLLWPSGRRRRRRAAGGSTKQAPRRATRASWRPTLNAMLAATLGPGKAQVKVNADLNVDKTTQKELDVRRQGRAAQDADRRPRSCAGGGGHRGRHGRHRLQRPDLLRQRRGRRRRQLATTSARQDRPTTASTRRSPRPRSRRARSTSCNVALLVDKSVPPADFAALQKTVAAAAGIDTARGDTIAGRADGLRQGGDAEGRPGADDAARPAQVGRPRPRRAALPVLHDPRHEQAREREPRHAGLADRDRGAGLAGAARGRADRRRTLDSAATRCCRRACRTPACISSTS